MFKFKIFTFLIFLHFIPLIFSSRISSARTVTLVKSKLSTYFWRGFISNFVLSFELEILSHLVLCMYDNWPKRILSEDVLSHVNTRPLYTFFNWNSGLRQPKFGTMFLINHSPTSTSPNCPLRSIQQRVSSAPTPVSIHSWKSDSSLSFNFPFGSSQKRECERERE